MGDVMVLMLDYNAAVEAAPMILPSLYRLRRERLQARWQTYLSNRISATSEEAAQLAPQGEQRVTNIRNGCNPPLRSVSAVSEGLPA